MHGRLRGYLIDVPKFGDFNTEILHSLASLLVQIPLA